MKRTLGYAVLVVTLLGATSLVVPARADDSSKLRRPTRRIVGASVTGEFQGRLRGEIRVGDTKIAITRRTVIRTVSGRMLSAGDHLSRSRVFVTGQRDRKGRLVADMILVREMREGEGSGRVGILPDDAAR